MDDPAVRTAQAAVEYVRSELGAALSQIPDSTQLEWRSRAQRNFQSRLDELEHAVRGAMAVLDLTREQLAAGPSRSSGTHIGGPRALAWR